MNYQKQFEKETGLDAYYEIEADDIGAITPSVEYVKWFEFQMKKKDHEIEKLKQSEFDDTGNCTYCDGLGWNSDSEGYPVECTHCNGTGNNL
jgi:hypothetical protein